MSDQDTAFAQVLDRVLSNVKNTLLSEHARLTEARQDVRPAEKLEPISCGMLSISSGTPNTRTQTQSTQSPPSLSAKVAPSNVAQNAQSYLKRAGSSIAGSEGSSSLSRRTSGFGSESSRESRQKESSKEKRHKAAQVCLGSDLDMKDRALVHLSTSLRRNTSNELGPSTCRRICSKVKSSLLFVATQPLLALDSFMAIVILVNAITIGANCDTAGWGGWIVINLIFCSLFLMEFLVKLCMLGWKVYFCGHDWGWHLLEVMLLVLSLSEVTMELLALDGVFRGSSLFRVFRLVRLSKLLRILKVGFLADLVLMLNGAVGGLRTLFWSLFLISLPLYVVALVLRETLGEEEGTGNGAESFSTLGKAFFNIFRCIVVGDCSDETGRPIFVLVATTYGWGYGVIYGFTAVLMTFGLFNVIVAIYVENTVSAAKHNDAKKKEQRLKNHEMVQEKTLELAMMAYSFKTGNDPGDVASGFVDMNDIYDMEITQAEFTKISENPGFSEILLELDIDEENLGELFDTLDVDQGGTLDVNEILKGITKLRGDAHKADVIAVLLGVRHVGNLVVEIMDILANQGKMLEWLQEMAWKNSVKLNKAKEKDIVLM